MQKQEIEKITEYIFLESDPEPADLIFVFGTRYKEPAFKAWDLYRRGFAKRILVSGGDNKRTGENEALNLGGKLLDLGVEKTDLFLEGKSTNTLENVLFSKKIIEKEIGFENVRNILAVCKHYHTRRALMTLKRNLSLEIKVVPTPYDIYDFNKSAWYQSKKGREKVLGEMEKISKYLAKGDICEL